MEKNGMRHWLRIGADIGILVGLVFVGLQVRQDRELKVAELVADSLQEHHARNIALMGSEPAEALSKLETGQTLEASEQFIAQAYFDSRFANWNRNSILENRGLLPASWHSGTLLADYLWANQYGIEAVESYLKSSPFLTSGFRSQLSVELDRVKNVHSNRGSAQFAD